MKGRSSIIEATHAWLRRRIAALDEPERLHLFLVRVLGTFNLYVLLFASIWVAFGWFPFPTRSTAIGAIWASLCAIALLALWSIPWQRYSLLATLPIFLLGIGGIAMLRIVGHRPSAFTLFFFWLWFAALAYSRRVALFAIALAAATHLTLALTTGQLADAFEAVLLLFPCYLISCLAVRISAERLETLWLDRAQARRAFDRGAALHAFSTLLASEHQLDRLLAALVGGLTDTFGYRFASVYLLQDGLLHMQAQIGYTTPVTEFALGEGITGLVAQVGQPILVSDGEANRHYRSVENQIGSQVSVPLIHQDEILGVLNVEGAHGELNDDDLQLLETLAGPAAVAIRNANLVRQLDDLAHRDPLTQLLNRRGILNALEAALIASTAVGGPRAAVTILLIDLNKFKAINDRYGHAMGDALLTELADLLAASVYQTTDRSATVGRLGGDEFLVVLPGADEAAALMIIERLTAILASHTFALLPMNDGLPPNVGYSLGVAVAPRDGTDVAALLVIADRAMYQAKRGSSGAIRFASGRARSHRIVNRTG